LLHFHICSTYLGTCYLKVKKEFASGGCQGAGIFRYLILTLILGLA